MLSIISVNYNSDKYLTKLLSSIEKFLRNEKIEIIIVNNGKEKLFLPKTTFKTKIVEVNENIGFGPANNLGAQQAVGKWLLFVNPDVEFIDDSLKNALNYIKKNKNIAVVGPQIIQFSTKAPQPWTSGKKSSLIQIVFRNTFRKPWNKKTPTLVDWVSGTTLLTSKKIFLEVGGFDEAFFMYFEDQDFCLRAKKNNQKIVFYPKFKILHHDGKSWGNKADQKKYYYQSQDIFFQKHHNFLNYKLLKIIRRLIKGK